MVINVVVGPPCSGKSTFVATNATAGVPRFDFDAVSAVVGGVNFNHDRPAKVSTVVAAMRRAFIALMFDPDVDVGEMWLIDTSPSRAFVERLDAAGAVFHVLTTSKEECLDRARRDGRPAGTEERIEAWFASPPWLPGDEDEEKEDRMIGRKSFAADVHVKDDDEAAEGTIEAYASVFDVKDSYGDVVVRGAFADSLKKWEDSGRTIPLLYGHNISDPWLNIGGVTHAVEDERGLRITAKLDMDNPNAAQVHRLIKAGRLAEMSFGFIYLDAGESTRDGETVYEVRTVDLLEVSVVPRGANPETEILSAKSAAAVLTAGKQDNQPAAEHEKVVDESLVYRAKLIFLEGEA